MPAEPLAGLGLRLDRDDLRFLARPGSMFRDPDLAAWLDRSRLNAARALRDHLAEPRMQSAVTRLLANNEPAIAKLERLLTQDGQEGTVTPT